MPERSPWLGAYVRDSRSGVSGRVIGIVVWDTGPTSLVVQPPARPDSTVPPTVYVGELTAEMTAPPQDKAPIQ